MIGIGRAHPVLGFARRRILAALVPLALTTALVAGAPPEAPPKGRIASRPLALKRVPPEVSSSVAPGPMSVRSALRTPATSAEPKAPLALSWTAGTSLPGGIVRYAHAQDPANPSSLYVVCGVDGAFNTVGNAWRYDTVAATWTPLAPAPIGLEGPSAVIDGGKLYLLGGGASGTGTTGLYIYDIAGNTWSAGPPLPRPVWGAAVGAHAGRIYMAGGDSDFSFGGTSALVDIYDIASGAWVGSGAPMPAAAVTAGYFSAGSYLYVVGGWGDTSPGANVGATQRYDMAADTWSVGPAFASARADFALVANSAKLYAMGGDANGGGAFDPTAQVESLDLSAWPGGAWAADTSLPAAWTAVNGGFCAPGAAGGSVWTVGGYSGSIVGNVYFSPAEPCAWGPYPALTARSFVDTCPYGGPGSNDGFADPGETLQYTLTLGNVGVGDLTAVQATLSTTTPGVSVTTATSTFGTIPGGGSVASPTPFVVELTTHFDCGDPVDFQLAIAAAEGSWTATFQQSLGDYVPAGNVTLVGQTFETWPLTGWTIADNGGGGCVWNSSLIGYGRPNYSGGSGDCADADSGVCGGAMDTTLTSPTFDLSAPGLTTAALQYKTTFYAYYCASTGDVDITTDGGTTWTNLAHYSGIVWQSAVNLDLTGYLGSAAAQVRFRYFSPCRDVIWQRDDLSVTAFQQGSCASIFCCPVIDLTPPALPNGQVSAAYSQTIAASGGTAPYTFAVTAGDFPPGLSLAPDGTLSGVPTTSGVYTFTITGTDDDTCAGSRDYTLVVCGDIELLPASLPGGNIGLAYGQALSALGGTAPYAYSLAGGALPDGLTLSAEGVLTGTPTATGTFLFDVAVVDANLCSDVQSFSIRVCTLTMGPAALVDSFVNEPYSDAVTAGGGSAPYTYAVTGGALPSGVALAPATGVLAGNPTQSGIFPVTLTATDATGCTISLAYSLLIYPATCGSLTISVPALGADSPVWPSAHGIQTGRLLRDGAGSTCAGKACPGVYYATGSRAFDAYTFKNVSCADACVTVTLAPNCPMATEGLFSTAYLGAFNPADLCANFLGDAGGSPDVGNPVTYQITIPQGGRAVVVVHALDPGGVCSAGYTLTLSGVPCSGLNASPSITADVCALGGHGGSNGNADPAETVSLSVSTQNAGSFAATGVTATLTSSSPLVTILQGSTTYPDIPTCGGASNSGPDFAFHVSGATPCGSTLPFTVHFASNEGSWTREFSLPVTPDTPFLTEAFETWPLAGWSITSSGIGGWFQGSTGYWPNWVGTGDFAEIDTYQADYGSGTSTLTSPTFSLEGYSSASLQYKTQFYDYFGTEASTVDITTDGGATWTNLQLFQDSGFGGVGGPQNVDLSAFVGQSNCQLRFVANSPDAYTVWEIDDLELLGSACAERACCPIPTVSGAVSGCVVPGLLLTTEAYDAYQWSLDGTPIPGATSQSYTATASGAYTVTITQADGCSTTSAPKDVTVYENPAPTIDGPSPACMSAALSTQVFTTYQWYRNNSVIPGATGRNYNAPAPGSYKVRVTNSHGCVTTSAPFVVGNNPTPLVSGPSVGCASVTLTTGAYASYQWFQNGSPIPGATAQSYEAVADGAYSVEVVTSLGCVGTSAPHGVTLFHAPTVTGPHFNTCPAIQLPLAASPGYVSYQWLLNGIPLAGATGTSYTALVSGVYAVVGTDTNGCSGPSEDFGVFIDFCPTSEVSAPGALFPARLARDAGSPTGYYLYFQRMDTVDGFNIYEGTVGSWYSHAAAPGNLCAADVTDLGTGEMRAPVAPTAGNHYYLVTAFGGGAEGPSGFTDLGVEIDPAQSSCGP